MVRWQVISIAVGGVLAAAVGAWAIAQRKERAPAQLNGPPPKRPPPQLVQGEDGLWYEGTVGGKVVAVGDDGATVNGTHFSLAELGLTAATGGAYGTTKYYLAHPGELVGDLKSVPDKLGDAIGAVGEWLHP